MDQTISQRSTSTRPATPSSDTVGVISGGSLPAGTCLREFEICGTIGEGGFSIVYAALDRQLGREVAIKEYIPSSLAGRAAGHSVRIRSEQHRESFDAGLAGFMNEARLLAQFKHPALVEVLQFWEENGTAYMVMPRYQGKTLRQFLKDRGGRCDERWLKQTLSPVLDVLEILHARSVFHRDIAPDNILVQNDGNAVLLDLGSAREILQDRESSVTVVVKPGYAPLEQYSGEFALPQGPWTDVYAFGALLHFAVTGSPPQASISRVMKDSCVALASTAHPGFSPEFLAAIDAALRLQPADRPQSARALRDALGMDDLPAVSGASAASQALAMLHQDDAITAIVSAEEMAEIFDQVARAIGAPSAPQAAAAPVSDAPVAAAETRDAPTPIAPTSEPEPSVGDPFAAAPQPPSRDESRFDDVDDLMSGRLVGSTDNIRVVSESRLEARIDSSAEDATPATGSPASRARLAAFAAAGLLLISLGVWLLVPGAASESDVEVAIADAPTSTAATSKTVATAPPQAAPASPAVANAALADTADPMDLSSPDTEAPSTDRSADALATRSHESASTAQAEPDGDWMGVSTRPDDVAIPMDLWAQAEPEPVQVAAPEQLAEVNLPGPAPAATRPRTAAVSTVAVRLNVMPWGEIWVDGKRAGDSPPIKQLDLAPGRYQLELRNGAFPPMRQQIEVAPGRPLSIEHRFAAAGGS